MSDDPKEVEEQMEKLIFICGDGWLAVFDLLTPRQLGLEIALLSHRFDCRVDEHFKTRRWALGYFRIGHKIDTNGTKQMQIQNSHAKLLPIPQKELPNKTIGFKGIFIKSYDENVIDFLRRFHPIFASCGTKIVIQTDSESIVEFVLRNIWPILKENIRGLGFSYSFLLRKWRQCLPSMLSDCPSLRVLAGVFPKFPPDDSANASSGQAVAKWLSLPCLGGPPKMLRCDDFRKTKQWSHVKRLKEAFANNAFSLANFIISFGIDYWSFDEFYDIIVVPFDLINNLTGQRLTLKQCDKWNFLLVHCPVARNEPNWAKWEEEILQWQFDAEKRNQIIICDTDEEVEENGHIEEFDFENIMSIG